MANQINIVVGAEVNGALQGLQQVERQSQKSFQKVAQTSGQAGQAVGNLSRIVQDAPFGFIGISNNLQPLFDNFTKLKSETGSVGGAFKSFASTLSGPAGIGLAFAAVTTAITFVNTGFNNWIKRTKEAKQSTDEYTKSLKEATNGVAQEAAKISTLVEFIKLETTTKKERNNAIKELQAIAPGYFASLNTEKASIQDITAAYDRYLLSLRRSVEARVVEKQLQDVIAKRLDLEKQLSVGRPVETEVRNGKVVVTAYNAIYASVDEVNTLTKELNATRQKELDLSKQLAILQPPKLKAEDFKAPKDQTNEIIGRAKELAKELEKIGAVVPEFTVFQTDAEQLQIAKAFLKQFQNVSVPFTIKADLSQIDVPPPSEGGLSDVAKAFERNGAILGQSFNEGVTKALQTGGEVRPENVRFRKFISDYENLQAAIKANNEVIAASINDVVGQAFSNLFSALKQGENAFRAFAQGVGTALLSVIERLIATAATAAVLSFIFPGGVAGAKGFQNIFGSLLGFRANGGPVTGRSPYIVGERGPELFVPSVSGNIVPNNQLGAFNGRPAFAAAMGGRSIVRGTDILLASARSQRSINRVNA